MFSKPSEFSGGTYFKPLEHMNDLALLIEPKRIDREVPNTYQGRTNTRDEVTADITVFGTSESLETGTPTEVIKSGKVVHGMLTSALERIVGDGAMVATLDKAQTKNGSGYVFRDVSAEVTSQVGAYYKAREESINEALADVPGFDDE